MTIDQLIWILEIVCTVLAATLMFRSFARLDEAERDLELARQLREDSLRTLDAALRIKNERKTI
jgi:hypothetical protein